MSDLETVQQQVAAKQALLVAKQAELQRVQAALEIPDADMVRPQQKEERLENLLAGYSQELASLRQVQLLLMRRQEGTACLQQS
jgi:hypothetical protein